MGLNKYINHGILVFLLLLLGNEALQAGAAGELKWKYQTGGGVESSPAIGADGTIYVGSNDYYLYALSPDGKLKWKYLTGNVVRCSPSIGADGTIYVGSYDDYLYAIKPDGTLKWKYQLGDDIYSSPAIGADGTVYVGSFNYGSYNNYFYALNSDGTLKWKYQTGGGVSSSPAIGAVGMVYVGSKDYYLYAFNPDGTLKWKYQTSGVFYSSPAVGADGTVYASSSDHYLYALNPDGTLKWRYQAGSEVNSSPAIGVDGTIYVGSSDNYLYALNPDGTLKWRYLTGYAFYSSPAVGADGTVYVGSYSGIYIYALNPDGTLKWKYQTGSTVYSSPAIGADGTVYVGSNDSYIYALDTGTTQGLANSAWPKIHHDLLNTGNFQYSIGPESPAVCPLYGDVTADSRVDIFDVLNIVRFALGQKTPTAQEKACADMNSDGTIDIFDVLACVNKALGKSLFLAGVTATDISRINEKELEADLLSLGADKALIADIFRLLDQQKNSPSLPKAFSLGQNSPNPFNPSTTISYGVPEGQAVQVSLKIYGLRGRLVRTLVDAERKPGNYSVFWDGRDGSGQQISSGIYFYRMIAGEFTQVRKMVLLK